MSAIRSMRHVALAGLAGLLLAAFAAIAAPASAQQDSDPLGFAIEAVDHESHFVLGAEPGSEVTGALRVRSTSEEDHSVFLRSTDVGTAATGGLDYGETGARPRGVGRWISLERTRLVVPAGGSVEVPFTARLPRDARPGDHFGGIVAYGQPPPSVQAGDSRLRVRSVSRLAIAVQMIVPGPGRRELESRGAEIRITPTGATLELRLASLGNELIPETTGRLAVFQGERRLFGQRTRIDAFVPETEIGYPVPWEGRPVEGTYRVRGVLDPEGAERLVIDETVEFARGETEELERETGQQAIESGGVPLWLILLLLVALIALAALATVHFRMRRRL